MTIEIGKKTQNLIGFISYGRCMYDYETSNLNPLKYQDPCALYTV